MNKKKSKKNQTAANITISNENNEPKNVKKKKVLKLQTYQVFSTFFFQKKYT